MFCPSCGREIADNSRFCQFCGASINNPSYSTDYQENNSSGYSGDSTGLNRANEINEALDAGDQALNALYRAKDELKGASNWGIVDMIGGGLISTFAKRSHMESADNALAYAREALQRYAKEVRDVDRLADIDLDMGGFMGAADYLFDNFAVDLLVQDKIENARRDVDRAIARVEDMQNQLRGL